MKRGFTCGAFDFLHAGHVAMLEEARGQCDYLIVGLQTNPQLDRKEKNRPIQSVFERFIQLKGCRFVDEVIPYDTENDLLNLLQLVKPDLRILGEEYKEKSFTGEQLDIPIYFNTRRHNYSSTDLRNRLTHD